MFFFSTKSLRRTPWFSRVLIMFFSHKKIPPPKKTQLFHSARWPTCCWRISKRHCCRLTPAVARGTRSCPINAKQRRGNWWPYEPADWEWLEMAMFQEIMVVLWPCLVFAFWKGTIFSYGWFVKGFFSSWGDVSIWLGVRSTLVGTRIKSSSMQWSMEGANWLRIAISMSNGGANERRIEFPNHMINIRPAYQRLVPALVSGPSPTSHKMIRFS